MVFKLTIESRMRYRALNNRGRLWSLLQWMVRLVFDGFVIGVAMSVLCMIPDNPCCNVFVIYHRFSHTCCFQAKFRLMCCRSNSNHRIIDMAGQAFPP